MSGLHVVVLLEMEPENGHTFPEKRHCSSESLRICQKYLKVRDYMAQDSEEAVVEEVGLVEGCGSQTSFKR